MLRKRAGVHCRPSINCPARPAAVIYPPFWLPTTPTDQVRGWLHQSCNLRGYSRAVRGQGERAAGARGRGMECTAQNQYGRRQKRATPNSNRRQSRAERRHKPQGGIA